MHAHVHALLAFSFQSSCHQVPCNVIVFQYVENLDRICEGMVLICTSTKFVLLLHITVVSSC